MTPPRVLPDGPLIAFYGDDFTGSSASMEATAFAGIETVLFLAPPTSARLQAFARYRAIGVAGVARAQSPAWMDEHLPPVFHALRRMNAPISQYKVCSTFDSSPSVGSIGRAIDLGAPILGDVKYARPDQNNAFAATVAGLSDALHLHARALCLPHPAGGTLLVEADLPPHMLATFRTLGFHAPPPHPPQRR